MLLRWTDRLTVCFGLWRGCSKIPISDLPRTLAVRLGFCKKNTWVRLGMINTWLLSYTLQSEFSSLPLSNTHSTYKYVIKWTTQLVVYIDMLYLYTNIKSRYISGLQVWVLLPIKRYKANRRVTELSVLHYANTFLRIGRDTCVEVTLVWGFSKLLLLLMILYIAS